MNEARHVPQLQTPRYLTSFDTRELPTHAHDVLVIGSGIAGLTAALCACETRSVCLVTKAGLMQTGTWYAQGGVAGAISEEDSTQLHFDDTIAAGAGLCDAAAVRVLVDEGPDRIGELIKIGASFDTFQGRLRLAREGGHSLARILHVGDTTGSAIQATLVGAVTEREQIEICEHCFVIDLLTNEDRCVGALVIERDGTAAVHFAPITILASGGSGCVFSVTTNPDISTGGGMAIAYRAGADLADVEFVQFHPTALDTDDSPRFLITEALRGEGAVLRDKNGRRFMTDVHPSAELAPRDVVIRAIVEEMRKGGDSRVWLDATAIDPAVLKEGFPMIWDHCASVGIDLANDLVPVSPAAHYMVGGVLTDVWGRTSVPGLYASGEVACTGVHGANRLASNSLLEGLVFSKRICAAIDGDANPPVEAYVTGSVDGYGEHGRAEPSEFDPMPLRRAMSDKAGVRRTDEGLRVLLGEISDAAALVAGGVSGADFEKQNVVTVAGLIARSALIRGESRGVHYRDDFPQPDDKNWRRRIVIRRDGADRMLEVV